VRYPIIALTLAAFLGIAIAAPTAPTKTRPSTEGRPISGNIPESTRIADRRTSKCIRSTPKLKRSIVDRRLATWRWQVVVGHPKTRSSFRDRTAIGCAYLRWIKSRWTLRADEAWRYYVELRDDPETAICHVFGNYCSEALAVADCESGISPRATNGQYLGAFQMGSSERQTYGHGETVYEQAQAAYRYFVASGRDWSPWSCRWAIGRS
jgi:hypothetical protein